MPSDGTFVRANIYIKKYLLHSHARNSLITYILMINYYHHYDLQEIISYYNIIIFYLYSATSIIGCGASQYAAIKTHTDNI